MTPEETLRSYEQGASGVEQYIRDAITGAYQNLKPELQDVRHYETQQLPEFYRSFGGYSMETGAADLSPQQRMAVASENVAGQAELARVARDVFDVRKAGMEDLVSSGIGAWDRGYAGAQSAYDRWWGVQQAEEAKRQFEAQMALEQEKLAAARAAAARANATQTFNPLQLTAEQAYAELAGLPRRGSGPQLGITEEQRLAAVNLAISQAAGLDRGRAMTYAGFSPEYMARHGYGPQPQPQQYIP